MKSQDWAKRVEELEHKLAIEQDRINALFQSGKIPTDKDWEKTRQIEKQLRTARGILTRQTKRKGPVLTKKISVMVTDGEYEILQAQAQASGLRLGKYVRELVRKGMEKVGL